MDGQTDWRIDGLPLIVEKLRLKKEEIIVSSLTWALGKDFPS